MDLCLVDFDAEELPLPRPERRVLGGSAAPALEAFISGRSLFSSREDDESWDRDSAHAVFEADDGAREL